MGVTMIIDHAHRRPCAVHAATAAAGAFSVQAGTLFVSGRVNEVLKRALDTLDAIASSSCMIATVKLPTPRRIARHRGVQRSAGPRKQ